MARLITILLASAGVVHSATTNTLSSFGVDVDFSSSVTYGEFVSGEYWVLANPSTSATVDTITPAWTGTLNGAEINPTYSSAQGFYGGSGLAGGKYSSSKNVADDLPLTITNECTLVITVASGSERSAIKTAVAITFLESIPPGDGASVFRPPYSGTDKTLYSTNDLRMDLLPSLSSSGFTNMPTLSWVETYFSNCLRMDHVSDIPRYYRPTDAYSMSDGYFPSETDQLNNAMLRLCMDDSNDDKLAAMIQFTQHALDRAEIVRQGYRRNDSGHNPNHRVVAAWAAYFLDINTYKTNLATATDFHEDRYLYQGINAVLWGEPSSEFNYWNYIMTESGSRSNKDPYRYIDGGKPQSVGASYQNITSQSLKGQALIYDLIPGLAALCPSNEISRLKSYAERWVNTGTWTSPDPAAPYDGDPDNYGVTFGPDGMGSYIAGSGRFDEFDGSNTDGGQNKSEYVAEVWDAYWEASGEGGGGGVGTPAVNTGRHRPGQSMMISP